MASLAAPASQLSPAELKVVRRRAILACLVGNLFEMFDFGVYGYFAVQIGRAIFPSKDPVVSILASFATYGVGFLMRPVGGAVLGSFGDRYGRRRALALTITLMALATGMTGLVPSYSKVGILAPLLLVCFRLLQGFSTGGEWGGATAFLVEYAPEGRKNFFASMQQLSTTIAQLLSVGCALALNAALPASSLDSWGWRLPFLLGFLLAPLGYYLRARVAESPAFVRTAEAGQLSHAPLKRVFSTHRAAVLTCLGITMSWTVGYYVFVTFLPTFAAQSLHLQPTAALTATIIGAMTNGVIVPIAGYFSDRFGRQLLILAAAGFVVIPIPLFAYAASAQTFSALLTLAVVAGMFLGIVNGAAPGMLCTLFPTRVRYTALSVGYNGAVMLFGGFAPFIATFLIKWTGSPIAPSFYVVFCAVVSLTVLCLPISTFGAYVNDE